MARFSLIIGLHIFHSVSVAVLFNSKVFLRTDKVLRGIIARRLLIIVILASHFYGYKCNTSGTLLFIVVILVICDFILLNYFNYFCQIWYYLKYDFIFLNYLLNYFRQIWYFFLNYFY